MAKQKPATDVKPLDYFADIKSVTLPDSYRQALQESGRDPDAWQSQLNGFIAQGGNVKADAISQAFRAFDTVGGTTSYTRQLDKAAADKTTRQAEVQARRDQREQNIATPGVQGESTQTQLPSVKTTPKPDVPRVSGTTAFFGSLWNSLASVVEGTVNSLDDADNLIKLSQGNPVPAIIDNKANKKNIKENFDKIKVTIDAETAKNPFNIYKNDKGNVEVDFADAADPNKWLAGIGTGIGSLTSMLAPNKKASFLMSYMQMYTGNQQDAMDAGLAGPSAILYSTATSAVQSGLELLGEAGIFKALKGDAGKEVIKRVVKDKSGQAISDLAEKGITQEVFNDVIEKTFKESVKELSDQGTMAVLAKQAGNAARKFKKGALPEAGTEFLQEWASYGAQRGYNALAADATTQPGQGEFNTDAAKTLSDAAFGAVLGGFLGGSIGSFAPNSKEMHETLGSFINADIKEQLKANPQATAQDLKANARVKQLLDVATQNGQFNDANGQLDQAKLESVAKKADLLYDSFYEFKDIPNLDAQDRLSMFNITDTRNNLQEARTQFEGAKQQVDQIQAQVDASKKEGNVLAATKLEAQKAVLEQQLGDKNPQTGEYIAFEQITNQSTQTEAIFQQALPELTSPDAGRKALARSFLNSNLYPDADFVPESETVLPDGSLVVRDDDSTAIRQVNTIQVQPDSDVVSQLDKGKYKPIKRFEKQYVSIDNYQNYATAAANIAGNQLTKASDNATSQFDYRQDATDLIGVASQAALTLNTNPSVYDAVSDRITKAYEFYNQIVEQDQKSTTPSVPVLSEQEFQDAVGFLPSVNGSRIDPFEQTILAKQKELKIPSSVADVYTPSNDSIDAILDIEGGDTAVPVKKIDKAISELTATRKLWQNKRKSSGREYTLSQIDDVVAAIENDLNTLASEKSYQQAPETRPVRETPAVVAEPQTEAVSEPTLTPEAVQEATPETQPEAVQPQAAALSQDDIIERNTYRTLAAANLALKKGDQVMFMTPMGEKNGVFDGKFVKESGNEWDLPSIFMIKDTFMRNNTNIEAELRDNPVVAASNQNIEAINTEAVTLNSIKQYAKSIIEGRSLLKRLSPQIERGRAAGGIRNVEATIISSRVEQSEDSSERGVRQKEALKKYAIEEGIFIQNPEKVFGELYSRGFESSVFVTSDRKFVNKVNDMSLHRFDIATFFDRLAMHNFLFPETKYELVGFTEMNGDFSAIVKQPFIQAAYESDRDDVKRHLEKLGFEKLSGMNAERGLWRREEILMSDINGKNNVLSDKKGNLLFIDPIFQLNTADQMADGNFVATEITDEDILENTQNDKNSQNENLVSEGTRRNTRKSRSVKSRYAAEAELSRVLESIENDAEPVQPGAGLAEQSAEEIVPGEETDESLTELIGRVDEQIERVRSADGQIQEVLGKLDVVLDETAGDSSGSEPGAEASTETVSELPIEPGIVGNVLTQITKAFPNIDVVIPQNLREFMDAAGLPISSQAPKGFIKEGQVLLNPDTIQNDPNTPLHEFGHIWTLWAKNNDTALYNKGVALVKSSGYLKDVKRDRNYSKLSEEAQVDEALARAIGNQGESFVGNTRKTDFKNWVKEVFSRIKQYFNTAPSIEGLTAEQLSNLPVDQFASQVAADLLSGNKISGISSEEVNAIMNPSQQESPLGEAPVEEIVEKPIEADESEAAMQWDAPVLTPGQAIGKMITFDQAGTPMRGVIESEEGDLYKVRGEKTKRVYSVPKAEVNPTILFSFGTPMPGEQVGTNQEFQDLARQELTSAGVFGTLTKDLKEVQKEFIAKTQQKYGWRYLGASEVNGVKNDENWDRDISKENDSYHLPGGNGAMVIMPLQGKQGAPNRIIKGIQESADFLEKQRTDGNPLYKVNDWLIKSSFNRLNNLETLVKGIDGRTDRILKTVIHDVKREASNVRNRALNIMGRGYEVFRRDLGKYSTHRGSRTLDTVEKLPVQMLQWDRATQKSVVRNVSLPLGTIMNIVATHQSQRSMGSEYNAREVEDSAGNKYTEDHTSAVVDSFYDVDPHDPKLFFSEKESVGAVLKGVHFKKDVAMEADAKGDLQPLKTAQQYGLFTQQEMDRL